MENATTAEKLKEVNPDDLHPSYKPFSFAAWIHRGDCSILPGAQFKLYENGTTNWLCEIKSEDSGDEWDGYIVCTNANKLELWRDHYHFNINDGGVTKRWDETRGPDLGKAHSYAEAFSISFVCNC